MNQDKSAALFARSKKVIPGGVNSPVRAFGAVGGTPVFIARASGPHIVDVDGNSYIDYVGSWGPMILGHAHPQVTEAVQKAASEGLSFGAPTEREAELAELMIAAVPSVQKVRFVNSGTEATMSAIRLARGFTGREKVVKFAGCYHGHSDLLLSQAGSGVITFGLPDTPGVPKEAVRATLTAPYNDLTALEHLFDESGSEIAAVIIEPVAGNMGVVPPEPGYLQGVRELTRRHGALLIFDEVMTGFRVHYGGAQSLYDIEPDLSCFGKIIGGGMPVGAYAGQAEIMAHVAPEGPVYQAGTLSGNPVAMAAGIATLRLLQQPGVYEQLETTSARLAEGLQQAAQENDIPVQLNRVGSMSTLFFTDQPVRDFASSERSDGQRYALFFHEMLKRGIYLAPSRFEALFTSLAHSEQDIETTIAAAGQAMAAIAR